MSGLQGWLRGKLQMIAVDDGLLTWPPSVSTSWETLNRAVAVLGWAELTVPPISTLWTFPASWDVV